LILYREVAQAWVGITVQDIDARLSGYFNLPGQKGVLVRMVEPRSPAQDAGLKDGDIIIEIAGQSVSDPKRLRHLSP
jgi:S1-C subfamily serine protease